MTSKKLEKVMQAKAEAKRCESCGRKVGGTPVEVLVDGKHVHGHRACMARLTEEEYQRV